jgi:hypothetical protein
MAQRQRFTGPPRGDTGQAAGDLTAALAAYQRGADTEHAALLALSRARLLVPVVATLAQPEAALAGDCAGQPGPAGQAEKESEMALPTLIGNDGRAAIIAFTGIEALSLWRGDARPVPAPASRVWHAAVAASQSVVIDVAGPVPFVVEGARLAALAAGEDPPLPHEDPDVRAVVGSAVAAEPGVRGCAIAPGASADLSVTLLADDADSARRAAQSIAARLAGRFRRGVELSASLGKVRLRLEPCFDG